MRCIVANLTSWKAPNAISETKITLGLNFCKGSNITKASLFGQAVQTYAVAA